VIVACWRLLRTRSATVTLLDVEPAAVALPRGATGPGRFCTIGADFDTVTSYGRGGVTAVVATDAAEPQPASAAVAAIAATRLISRCGWRFT
jgi:hypothetical protein